MTNLIKGFVPAFSWCLIVIVCSFVTACGGAREYDEKVVKKVRLSRVWSSSRWMVVGAINQRGPLSVLIALPKDFRAMGLESRAWIKPEVVKPLSLKVLMSLRDRLCSSGAALSLDGLRESIKTTFIVLNDREQTLIPKEIDAIIPASEIFGVESSEQLQVSDRGYLQRGEAPKSMIHDRPWVSRFAERWRPTVAYPELIIAERVDLKDQIEVRWREPRTELPDDLWLMISLSPQVKKSDQLLMVHLREQKRPIPSANELKTLINVERERQVDRIKRIERCPIYAPCQLKLLDVLRRPERCLHNICMVTLP